LLIKLGEWKVFLDVGTDDVRLPIKHIGNILNPFRLENININETSVEHLLIVGKSFLEKPVFPISLRCGDYNAWQLFLESLTSTISNSNQENFLDTPCFSWPYKGFENIKYSGFSEKIQGNNFSALVFENPTENAFIQIFLYLLYLAIIWHANNGHICLHSSAVVNKNNGFLFLGASDSGKTTIARLSDSIGIKPLGDDLNFVVRENQNHYFINAAPSPNQSPVGYSMLRPQLKCIFKLVVSNI